MTKWREGLQLTLASGSLMGGAYMLADVLRRKSNIADAVYAHADKITPEIIKQAEQLASSQTYETIPLIASALGLGLFLDAYRKFRK